MQEKKPITITLAHPEDRPTSEQVMKLVADKVREAASIAEHYDMVGTHMLLARIAEDLDPPHMLPPLKELQPFP